MAFQIVGRIQDVAFRDYALVGLAGRAPYGIALQIIEMIQDRTLSDYAIIHYSNKLPPEIVSSVLCSCDGGTINREGRDYMRDLQFRINRIHL